MNLTSNLCSMNARVSSSSSSGWLGGLSGLGSSTGSMSPMPKKLAHRRLTAVRAKKGFVAWGHPVSQCLPTSYLVLPFGNFPVQIAGFHFDVAAADGDEPLFGVFAVRLDAAEKRGELPELLLLPRSELVIVALGAVQI